MELSKLRIDKMSIRNYFNKNCTNFVMCKVVINP